MFNQEDVLANFTLVFYGSFKLILKIGMPLLEAMSYLQKNVDKIQKVDVLFNSQDPISADIILKLTNDGILLRFEPISQRLKMLEVFDLSKIRLTYVDTLFTGPSSDSTFYKIYKLFGPSYPGKYDKIIHSYILSYPGIIHHMKILIKKKELLLYFQFQKNIESMKIRHLKIFQWNFQMELLQ
jgi:hypothetical protein